MTEIDFTQAAAIASYYGEAAHPGGHLVGIHGFELYASGIIDHETATRQVCAAQQNQAFRPPTYQQWLEAPESADHIAARVAWQKRYAEMAQPAENAFMRTPPAARKAGNYMETAFFEHNGEPLVVKQPNRAHKDIGAYTVEMAVAALVRQDQAHPTLEQLHAFSYAQRRIITKCKPGQPPSELSPEQLAVVTREHLDFAVEGLYVAARRGVKLETQGTNMHITPTGDINFFDLSRTKHLSEAFLLYDSLTGLMRMLGRAAATAPWEARLKIRHELQQKALQAIHAVNPDFVPLSD